MVIKATELEVQNILFGKLEDSSLVASQKMAFISYKEPKARLVVQTPEFLTETYGIPREGPFYSTPKSRAFFKLPFCHERHMHEGEVLSTSTRSSRRSTNTATRTSLGRTCSEKSLPRSTSLSR